MKILQNGQVIDINEFIDFSKPYVFPSGTQAQYTEDDLYTKENNQFKKLEKNMFYISDFLKKVSVDKIITSTNGNMSGNISTDGYNNSNSYAVGGGYYNNGWNSNFTGTSGYSNYSSTSRVSLGLSINGEQNSKTDTVEVLLFPEFYIQDPTTCEFIRFDAFSKIPQAVIDEIIKKDNTDIRSLYYDYEQQIRHSINNSTKRYLYKFNDKLNLNKLKETDIKHIDESIDLFINQCKDIKPLIVIHTLNYYTKQGYDKLNLYNLIYSTEFPLNLDFSFINDAKINLVDEYTTALNNVKKEINKKNDEKMDRADAIVAGVVILIFIVIIVIAICCASK